MQKITPCFWFDHQAEEAAQFYVSLFNNSRILEVTRYSGEGPLPEGQVLTVSFQLDGQEFVALNGGPEFKFSEAISMVVHCEDQAEIDRLWAALTDGGSEQQCGWLKDRYGLSWQIVPNVLYTLLKDPDPDRVRRVTAALLKMIKLDIRALQNA